MRQIGPPSNRNLPGTCIAVQVVLQACKLCGAVQVRNLILQGACFLWYAKRISIPLQQPSRNTKVNRQLTKHLSYFYCSVLLLLFCFLHSMHTLELQPASSTHYGAVLAQLSKQGRIGIVLWRVQHAAGLLEQYFAVKCFSDKRTYSMPFVNTW